MNPNKRTPKETIIRPETIPQLNISNTVIISKIHEIRGKKVMLSNDLAELYQVETKRLNEQVKRNIGRFPMRYMFRLTQE